MKKIYELPSWLKDPFFAILALAFFAALGIGSVARAEDGFPKVDQIPCNRPIDPKDSDGVQRAKHFLCVDRSLDHFLHSYFYSEYRPFYWNQLGFGDFELEALAKSDPELMAFWGRLKNQRESLGYENLRQNGGSAAWEEFDRKYIAWLVLPENAVQVAKLMRKLDPEAIQKGLDEIDGHWGIRASFHIGEDWDYYRQNVQFRDKVSRVLGEIRKHREPFLAQAPIPPTEKAETSVGAMPERPADYLFLLRLLDLRHLSFQDPPIRDEFTLHQLVDHTFQKNEELYSSATGLLDRFERVSESDGPEAARKWVDANRAEVLEVVRSLNLPKLRDWATDAVSSKSLKPFQLKLQSSYDELARFQTGASALASRGRSSGGEAGQICGMIADRVIQDQRIDPEFLFKLALKNPGDPVLTRLFFGSKAGETASPAVAKVFDSIDIAASYLDSGKFQPESVLIRKLLMDIPESAFALSDSNYEAFFRKLTLYSVAGEGGRKKVSEILLSSMNEHWIAHVANGLATNSKYKDGPACDRDGARIRKVQETGSWGLVSPDPMFSGDVYAMRRIFDPKTRAKVFQDHFASIADDLLPYLIQVCPKSFAEAPARQIAATPAADAPKVWKRNAEGAIILEAVNIREAPRKPVSE